MGPTLSSVSSSAARAVVGSTAPRDIASAEMDLPPFSEMSANDAAQIAIRLGAFAATQSTPIDIRSFSPQMLLALVGTRVRDLDQQLNQLTAQLTSTSQRAEAYQQRLQDLQLLQQHIVASGSALQMSSNVGLDRRQVGEIRDLCRDLGIDLPLNNKDMLEGGTVAAAIDQVRAKLSELNGGNEMAMLQLQEIVQQRGAIIQLASNLMNSMNESSKSIIGNMR